MEKIMKAVDKQRDQGLPANHEYGHIDADEAGEVTIRNLVPSSIISDFELDCLVRFDGKSGEDLRVALDDHKGCHEFAEVAEKLISSTSDSHALRFVLTQVENLLIGNLKSSAGLFCASPKDLLSPSSDSDNELADSLKLGLFLKLITNTNSLVRGKALHIVSLLASLVHGSVEDNNDIKVFLSALLDDIEKTEISNIESFNLTLRALSTALGNIWIHKEWSKRNGCVRLLKWLPNFASLTTDTGDLLLLCIWVDCFEPTSVACFTLSDLRDLASILRADYRKNIMRLCLATIASLLQPGSKNERLFSEALIEMKIPRLLGILAEKPSLSVDPELVKDLKFITEVLIKNFKVLTTFERHEKELQSGKLRWSMIHDEMFWKENALFFQNKDFEAVKLLVELLKSTDEVTVAVACSDLGFFVQYFPNGKLIVNKYGGKNLIMDLLSHENAEIKKLALSSISKLMVTDWSVFLKSSD